MLNILPFEQKIILYFLKDMGLNNNAVSELALRTTILKRDLDAVGFYTTLNVRGFDMSLFKPSPWTNKLFGKQRNGTIVDLLIHKKGDLLLLEGATFDSENYRGFEDDLQVFKANKDSNGHFNINDTSSPL